MTDTDGVSDDLFDMTTLRNSKENIILKNLFGEYLLLVCRMCGSFAGNGNL